MSTPVDERSHLAAGRQLAHALIAEIDADPRPLLNDTDRVPMWPDGVVGSISHCHWACAVAVSSRSAMGGLGIDLEPAETLHGRYAIGENYLATAVILAPSPAALP